MGERDTETWQVRETGKNHEKKRDVGERDGREKGRATIEDTSDEHHGSS